MDGAVVGGLRRGSQYVGGWMLSVGGSSGTANTWVEQRGKGIGQTGQGKALDRWAVGGRAQQRQPNRWMDGWAVDGHGH